MEPTIRFSEDFKGKMLLLALTVGLITALSMPFTYFVLSLVGEYGEAQENSQRLARQLTPLIKNDPKSWQDNLSKLNEILAEYRHHDPNSLFTQGGLAEIAVIDNNGVKVHHSVFAKQFLLDITARTEIVDGTKVYGYLEIKESTKGIWTSTLLLQVIFILLGGILGYGIYRYPVNIVTQAEIQIESAFANLHFLSHYDPLTQLPNRIFFQDAVIEALNIASHRQRSFAILFLDLDRFKLINDTLGHHCGDLLLKNVAQRIVAVLEPQDIFARHAGDEFTILVQDINTRKLEEIAQNIITALIEPFSLEGYEFFVSVSIGISQYPENGSDLSTLLKHADVAMYKAKELGKNSYQFYSSIAKPPKLELLQLERSLRKALQEEKGIELFYQPIVRSDTGELLGMEALLRGSTRDIGCHHTDDIISVAEDTGLIVPLGDYVLRTACQEMSNWCSQGMPTAYVSVNLSPQQFQQADLLEKIASILRDTGLEPSCLQLEITEGLPMLNEEPAIAKMMAIRKLGVKLAIDDFGTGYSSLGRVKNFPIDTIKIDKSFIINMMSDPKDAAIVRAIVTMANSLDLDVIAEGIETQAQLDCLLRQRVKAIQGYLISPPVTAMEFIKVCKQNEWHLPTNEFI